MYVLQTQNCEEARCANRRDQELRVIWEKRAGGVTPYKSGNTHRGYFIPLPRSARLQLNESSERSHSQVCATMKTLLVFLGFIVVATYADTSPAGCIKNNNQCIRSAECCTGCCNDGKCVAFNDGCIKDSTVRGAGKGGPCDLLDPPCPQDQVCVLHQVQCIRHPCDPIPTCVPRDYQDYE